MAPRIRAARASDRLCTLLYASAPLSYDAYFGGSERSLRKLGAITPLPGHIAGWDACAVAEEEGRLVGLLASCATSEYDRLARRSHVLAFSRSAPWRWPAMLRVIRLDAGGALEPPAGAWYVDALAVEAGARRRGVGQALLEEAERRAVASGCRILALDTAAANTPARALYARCGMVAGTPVPGPPELGAAGGAWVPYVKAL